jgi:hypothetical protein
MGARARGAAGDGRVPHVMISTSSAYPVDSLRDGPVVLFCKSTPHATVSEMPEKAVAKAFRGMYSI